MIFGTGVDVVDVKRVQELIERHGERFLRKVFQPAEITYCHRKRLWAQHFAARIAAKEAASKALGTGWRRGVHWKCFEVTRERSGKPALALHGRAQELAAEAGVTAAHLSLTHDGGLAIAFVVMEK